MKFATIAEYFFAIEETRKRLEKTRILRKIIEECDSGEVSMAIYLALGILRPKYDKLEFNLADKMVLRAIAIMASSQLNEVERQYREVGDLGEVVVRIKRNQNQDEGKTVGEVYGELRKIAMDSGKGSQERKIVQLAKLLAGASGLEAKYIVRIVLSKLRLGFADKTILDALSYIEGGDKSAREKLENLYQIAPDVGELAKIIKERGLIQAVKKIRIKMGRPIMSALASRLPTADEIIKKMGKVIVEPKFDGTRVQIHFVRGGFDNHEKERNGLTLFGERSVNQVKSFTRNLEENSEQFPELARIGEQLKADEVILDSEAVGYDPQSGKMVPFQLTITRKRKHGVVNASVNVPLKFFVFDILALDGESLLELPLHERRKILTRVIKNISQNQPLVIDEMIETDKASELRDYHKKQLERGLEGVVIKKSEGRYVPGRQGFNWVKLKEEEGQKGKLSDTIDAVVMGYYRGKGKRTGFGIGAFLVGIRGKGGQIVTIAKIGTGLSDEQFRQLKEKLMKFENAKRPSDYLVDKILEPDVWVEPEVVVEVAADEITISPNHTSKYALRFPRLVKFREDKSAQEITSIEELTEIASGVYS